DEKSEDQKEGEKEEKKEKSRDKTEDTGADSKAKSADKTARNGDRNKTGGARGSKSKGGAASDDPDAKKGTLTVATADQLLYEDNLHRAPHTTDAPLVGEQGGLQR